MPYKSSLSNEEWKIVETLLSEILPSKKQTRPANWSATFAGRVICPQSWLRKREILDGIFYQLKNGCNWQYLPKDLPPYTGVY